MEYCQNILVSQDLLHQQQPEEQLLHNTLDDLFSTHHTTTERDMSLEWLSVFVEDCLTSSGTCLPPPQQQKAEITQVKNNKLAPPQFLHEFVIPGKARSKRKRRTPLAQKSINTTFFSSWPKNQKTQLGVVPFLETPLLNQAYWLADSELIIMPENKEGNGHKEEEDDSTSNVQQQQQGRRCSHCLAQKTPQWRGGPLGPKTLCNACGVRYKKGRLFPEYRPAKSPTFVSYKHSNSHKKVLEMRSMATIPN